MLDPRTFDRTRPLAMGKFATIHGHDLNVGAPVKIVDGEPENPGDLTLDEATHLWAGGRIVYSEMARPTAVETPEQAAERLTDMEPLGDGKFLIRAPWLTESLTITGEEAAQTRRGEVVEEGVALYRNTAEVAGEDAAAGAIGGDGWSMTEAGSNGYYEITGPGLDQPEKVRGKANAEQRLAELRGEAGGVTTQVGDDQTGA